MSSCSSDGGGLNKGRLQGMSWKGLRIRLNRRATYEWSVGETTSFLSKKFRLLAGHDYPVNLMTDSVLNLMCK